MEKGKKARVIKNEGDHFFEIGQIVSFVEEVTDRYNGDEGLRYFEFVDEDGIDQHLDDSDFEWVE